VERHDPWPVALDKWLAESRDRNPYASGETMRAWDNVIRNHLADALEAAAARWRAWRQEAQAAMPLPTRADPFPDAARMAALRALEAQANRCSEAAAAVRALEAPAQDRVYNRVRSLDTLLETLIAYDSRLALLAEEILDVAQPGPLSEEPARRARLEAAWAQMQATLRERLRALTGGAL
jgi:hypothetical protein